MFEESLSDGLALDHIIDEYIPASGSGIYSTSTSAILVSTPDDLNMLHSYSGVRIGFFMILCCFTICVFRILKEIFSVMFSNT